MNLTKDPKEDITKSLKESCENIHKQCNIMKKTAEDMQVQIETLKKTRHEIKLEMKNLGSQIKVLIVSFTNRTEDREEGPQILLTW